jgi:tetratricopeptide (TPR) repeat protein
MLSWLASRSTNTLAHKGAYKVPSINSTGKLIRHRSPVCLVSPASTIHSAYVAKSLYQSGNIRTYAKLIKRKTKTATGVKTETKPVTPIYDEDLEDENAIKDEDFGIEDVTESLKGDASFLKSSSQIEEILRHNLPPELVEQAIAEHRRVYSAYQKGTLSEADAKRAGFVPKVDTKHLLRPDPEIGSPISTSASTATPSTSASVTSSSSLSSTPKKVSKLTSAPTKSTSHKSSSSTATATATPSTSASTKTSKSGPSATDATYARRKVQKETKRSLEKSMATVLKALERNQADYERESQEFLKRDSVQDRNDDGGGLLREKEAKLNAILAKNEALQSNAPKKELPLHVRMDKLKGILSGTSDEDDEELIQAARASNIILDDPVEQKGLRKKLKGSIKPSPVTSSQSYTQIAIKARELVAKGRWDEALELYRDLARLGQSAAFLSTFSHEALVAKQYHIAGKAAIEAFNIDKKDLKANVVAAKVFIETHDEDHPDAVKKLAVAQQHIDRALEQHPDWPDLLAVKGRVYMCRKLYKKACIYLKAALVECDLKKIDRLLRLPMYRDYAKSLAGRGEYKSALEFFKLAHQLDPTDIEIVSLLAELHERGFDDLDSASHYYRMAVQIKPDDVPSLVRLGQLFADPSYSGQDLASARQCYERAMMLQPHNDFWFPLGWLSMHMGENDRALACLKKSAELDENPSNRWTSIVLMAELYAFDSHPDTQGESLKKAIQLYQFALDEKSDPEVHMNLAKCFLRAGRINDAEALLHAIKLENPDNIDLRCVLAEAYYMENRKMEAMREIDEILVSHPNEVMALYMKGKYLYDTGDYASALPFLEKSVSESLHGPIPSMTDDPKLAETLALLESKVKEILPQKLDDLRTEAQKAMSSQSKQQEKVHPQSILRSDGPEVPSFTGEAFKLLSRCYFEAEQWAEAKKAIGYALGHTSEDANLLSALGECQLKLGEVEDAIMTFRKASVLDPTAIRPKFQLGNLVLEHGYPDQAMAYYEKALGIMEKISAASAEAGAAISSEDMDEVEVGSTIYAIYVNMKTCCIQLAAQDRKNAAKYMKQAKHWEELAKQLEESVQ